ncbi:uncharacterized protein CMU_003830 [Cryptosporidium muris RN66]|uniref:Protease prsW family protein n=1 Tax=Cryptosporidium muris (strain RN66) TaxID=441375 RepID=B6AK03_CRYMR|nr:uncharacterized protein CMU_003830 [Cryptosporidium muris RN66]EEA08544.1 hypothetical protein, conserved [Cryptosporidium muris RN66]|eukprot:XP_002142893.1 hypothetical protein [Cryptosporidium muris RN66]
MLNETLQYHFDIEPNIQIQNPTGSNTNLNSFTGDNFRAINGTKNILYYGLVSILVVTAILIYYKGINGIFLMLFGISPAILIIYMLIHNHSCLSINILLDMFFTGATLSITLTIIIESILLLIFRKFHGTCLVDNIKQISNKLTENTLNNISGISSYIYNLIWCMSKIIIFYVMTVGIVEEIFKLIPTKRIKVNISDINSLNSYWWRYIRSPRAYVIANIASASGFATVENIAYLFTAADRFDLLLPIALARGILSIPFHIFATGYASILLAKYIYRDFNCISTLVVQDNYVQIEDDSTENTLCTIVGNNNQINPQTLATNNSISSKFEPGVSISLLCVLPSSILHGIYDACLVMILMIKPCQNTYSEVSFINGNQQSVNHSLKSSLNWKSKVYQYIKPVFSHIYKRRLIELISFLNSAYPQYDKDPNYLYSEICNDHYKNLVNIISTFCLTAAMLSLILCITLFFYEWRRYSQINH